VARKSDPYETLGVDRDADDATIKSAYRRKAKSAHPDVGGDREDFEQIERAHRLLANPKSRANFDEPQADNVAARAREQLALMLKAILTVPISPDVDIVALMKGSLRADILQLRGKLEGVRLVETHAKTMRGRLKRERSGTKVLRELIDSHLGEMRQAIAQFESDIADRKRALEILDHADFEFECEAARYSKALGLPSRYFGVGSSRV
jgi:curved DNA-binding protein CbpA